MIWFVKLITDPFTDIVAYYNSVDKIFRAAADSEERSYILNFGENPQHTRFQIPPGMISGGLGRL